MWCLGFRSVKNGIYLMCSHVFVIRVGVCLSFLFYFFMCCFLCDVDVDDVDVLMSIRTVRRC